MPAPIVDWICKEYPHAEKIVEVGIGNRTQVISSLDDCVQDCELIATDIEESNTLENVDFYLDDIMNPDLSIYKGSDLIFSLRAPPEFYSSLLSVSEKSGSDLLVMPVSSEESPSWGDLINYSGLSFYLMKNSD